MKISASFKVHRIAILLYVLAGICLVGGIFVGTWHNSAVNERETIKSTGQRVNAVAVTRSEIEFISNRGVIRTEPLVSPTQGTLQQQDTYTAFYDRSDPTRVVLDQDDSAYSITIWIVALKLIGSSVIIFYFARRTNKKSKLTV